MINKKILPIIAIAGNAKLAKTLSEKFARRGRYFAIMEEPWVSRPDFDTEIIKRNNLLALIPHKHLVFAGCTKKSCDLMRERLPVKYRDKIITINNESDIEKSLKPISHYFNKTSLEKEYINYSDLGDLSNKEQIGIIENNNSVGEVIAETYCITNNYKILKIKGISKDLVDECEDLLRDWNCGEDDISRQTAKEKLFRMVRSIPKILEEKNFYRIIFFTRGIPYGILPFKTPVAHLLLERDLGLQILRGYYRTYEKNPGIALALICDPGEIPDSESTKIKKILVDRGVELVDLTDGKATPYRFMHLIERYPFDFCMISSHASEVDGRRITEEFVASNGIKYTVVYDLYATFAPIPGSDKVIVSEMTVPISINGASWSDKKALKESKFNLLEFNNRERDKEKIIKTEDCKKVKFSNALQLYKLPWMPLLHTVGETRFPIIFNNACSSWMEMANRFIFASALVYIGTTKDISTTLASSCSSKFVELALKRKSMLYALFQAQGSYARQLGYSPYLYWGYPETSLRPTPYNKKRIREERVRRVVSSWRKDMSICKDEDKKKKINAILECILEVS